VLNATSGSAAMAALVAAGEAALAGKVLIQVSNPLDFSRGMLPTLGPGEHPTASVSRSSARSPPYAWSRR